MRRIMDDIVGHAFERPITAVVCALALVLVLTTLLWPESVARRERRIAEQLDRGSVVEIARGEDGARLWAVRRDGRTIYFSKGSVAIDDEKDKEGTS